MAKSTAQSAAARFRQLSCLGLDKEAVIPEMLRELHGIIPSFSNTFHFADEQGDVENIYFENTDLLKYWPLYQAEVYERPREREFRGLAFSDASRRVSGPHELMNVLEVDEKTFHQSDYYNLVVRHVGYASNFLRLYFRQGSKVLGGVTVWRSPSAVQWKASDKRRLSSLASFFIHAVTARASDEGPFVESSDRGLIIADTGGKVRHMSAEGRRLLFMASHPRSVESAAWSTFLPPALARLCGNLARVFAGDGVEGAPIYRHANVWGGFIFRAEWLPAEDNSSGLIGITVSHQLPLSARLVRGTARLPLSPRQAEVAVMLATGRSNEVIAERLAISFHTANEHSRWIYNKLDVHSRAELVRKMLTA